MRAGHIFIRRPIGTTLLALGLFLVGALAYHSLPVASLPTVEYPTITVSASWPGAAPTNMAAIVAAPLERQLSKISSLNDITSTSTSGQTSITLQFDLDRNIDAAARDVQAAINAALRDLPADLPSPPAVKKYNPAAVPLISLALTSDTLPPSRVYELADTIISQRISRVKGVSRIDVGGADQPALRIRVNPIALTALGLGMEDVRTAIVNANAAGVLGNFDGLSLTQTISTNGQIQNPNEYRDIVVRGAGSAAVHLSEIATVEVGVRNSRAAAWFNGKPAILLFISKEASANVVETVDRVNALMPELKGLLPAGIQISVLHDRTQTIRASVFDLHITLAAAIALAILLVFVFVRDVGGTIAAAITIPLALAGTFACMWAAGFSINALTLMALIVSVGFMVDDAIVLIENFYRHLKTTKSPVRAALKSVRQVGLTVFTIGISLFAAFIPVIFMNGVIGRMFREFSLTIGFAIAISTAVSLAVTPVVCAHFLPLVPNRAPKAASRRLEDWLDTLTRAYSRSLAVVLRHRATVLTVLLCTIALTIGLYVKVPKGYLPQDDGGFVYGMVSASPDISYQAMLELQQRATEPILLDPAVASVNSSVGNGAIFGASINSGRLYVSLKPLAERRVSTQAVIERLRPKFEQIPNVRVQLFSIPELHVAGTPGPSRYQFKIWTPDIQELKSWLPRVHERVVRIPGIIDVSADRDDAGLQANVVIDRDSASRLGVRVQDINNVLNNSFSQRQISTIFTDRNQYQIILETDPQFQRDPSDLGRLRVSASDGTQIPLSTFAHVEKGLAPVAVNHQGQFPAATFSFNLAPDKLLETATREIGQAISELHIPDTLHVDFSGDARLSLQNARAQPLLIIAALMAVYIILGVLYESLLHPLTIMSTLPSAALGALLALTMLKAELSIVGFIGIILLIGIVKKNGIMLIDFALEGERKRQLTPEQAISEACLARFRPILMTNLAAVLTAVPLVLATGPGSELQRPLGITIVGGLLLSQLLTLYTTPVVYVLLSRLSRRTP